MNNLKESKRKTQKQNKLTKQKHNTTMQNKEKYFELLTIFTFIFHEIFTVFTLFFSITFSELREISFHMEWKEIF